MATVFHFYVRSLPMAALLIGRKQFVRSSVRWSDRGKHGASGFSLIEVLVSMVILTTGLVSLLGVFGLAMSSTQTSQNALIAKQLANESYESIITARNTTQINWDDIQNTGSTT